MVYLLLIGATDQSHYGCVINKLDDAVSIAGGDTEVGVKHEEGWTQDAALRYSSVEDNGGVCGGAKGLDPVDSLLT